jgi:hypothetical protein
MTCKRYFGQATNDVYTKHSVPTAHPVNAASIAESGLSAAPASSNAPLIGAPPSVPSSQREDPIDSSASTTRRRRSEIKLQEGFVWDRESLALLCRWKEICKKGSQTAADSGEFPGHIKESLNYAWNTYRMEARQAYREVFEDKRG